MEVFEVMEKLTLKQKWTIGPKIFCSEYLLQKSNHLHGELFLLCRRRNAYTHSKITLRDDSNKILLSGSLEQGMRMDSVGRKQLKRFLTLPYELFDHLLDQIRQPELKWMLSHIIRDK